MSTEPLAILADVLVVLGLVVTTLGVLGMFRMPDVYTELHAASKAVFLGIIAFLLASMTAGDGAVISRSALIAVFLVLTTPVGAHVIAQSAWRRGEPMQTPGAIDESGRRLPDQPSAPVSEVPGRD